MIADKDSRAEMSKEDRLALIRARRAETAALFEKLGIPYEDTTLEHEGQVSVRFISREVADDEE